ncbi:MAG: hypothetical protein ABIW79_02425 [Gemmatimonas sp.]
MPILACLVIIGLLSSIRLDEWQSIVVAVVVGSALSFVSRGRRAAVAAAGS